MTSLDGNVTDIEGVLDALSSDDDSVKIYGGLLDSGKTYEFTLTVTNFLNRADNYNHTVTKNSDPVPALTLSSSIDLIDGEVYVSEDFSIKTNAIVSKSMMFTLKAVNSSSPSSSFSFLLYPSSTSSFFFFPSLLFLYSARTFSFSTFSILPFSLLILQFFFLFLLISLPSYASPSCSFFCPLLFTQLQIFFYKHFFNRFY